MQHAGRGYRRSAQAGGTGTAHGPGRQQRQGRGTAQGEGVQDGALAQHAEQGCQRSGGGEEQRKGRQCSGHARA